LQAFINVENHQLKLINFVVSQIYIIHIRKYSNPLIVYFDFINVDNAVFSLAI